MRKSLIALVVGLLMIGMMGTVGLAQPPHGHVLILHAEVGVIGGAPHLVGFHRCIDLANGRKLPLNAHHARLHEGRAGTALLSAGHGVAPAAGLAPWTDCADLVENFMPLPLQ